jgi:hypothetical protein
VLPQSLGEHGIGHLARRRRARSSDASNLRVRNEGDDGDTKQTESAAAPDPLMIANAAL